MDQLVTAESAAEQGGPGGAAASSPDQAANRRRHKAQVSCGFCRRRKCKPKDKSESGSMHVGPSGTVFVGSAHWNAIIDEMAELKGSLQLDDEAPADNNYEDDNVAARHPQSGLQGGQTPPRLLLGRGSRQVSKEELLSQMPGRSTVDRLVFGYFNQVDAASTCIHRGAFFCQYELFWKQPLVTSPAWIGLLYGVMCLSTLLQLHSRSPYFEGPTHAPECSDPSVHPQYLEQLIQSLDLADYTYGGPWVIETLLHCFYIEHMLHRDTEPGTWILFGVIVRLALRMGYHRDPAGFPAITPFQGEMRRRVWTLIYSGDIIISMQLGTPRMINDAVWDTAPPANLLDSDFDQDSKVLPPSRPETELTPVLYLIARYKLFKVMGTVADISVAARPPAIQTIEDAERRLEEVFSVFPPPLVFTTLSKCLADSPVHILHRLIFTIEYNKALVILHRRHMLAVANDDDGGGQNSPRAAAQLTRCIDAALQILEYQSLIDAEVQPGGTLCSVGRKVNSTLVHDFLVATSVLGCCLYRGSHDGTGAQAGRIRRALRRSLEIWRRSSPWSREARKVVDFLSGLSSRMGSDPDCVMGETGWSESDDHPPPAMHGQNGSSGLEAGELDLGLQPDVMTWLDAGLDLAFWRQ